MLAGVFSNEDVIVQKKPEVYHMVLFFLFVHLFYIFTINSSLLPLVYLLLSMNKYSFLNRSFQVWIS